MLIHSRWLWYGIAKLNSIMRFYSLICVFRVVSPERHLCGARDCMRGIQLSAHMKFPSASSKTMLFSCFRLCAVAHLTSLAVVRAWNEEKGPWILRANASDGWMAKIRNTPTSIELGIVKWLNTPHRAGRHAVKIIISDLPAGIDLQCRHTSAIYLLGNAGFRTACRRRKRGRGGGKRGASKCIHTSQYCEQTISVERLYDSHG